MSGPGRRRVLEIVTAMPDFGRQKPARERATPAIFPVFSASVRAMILVAAAFVLESTMPTNFASVALSVALVALLPGCGPRGGASSAPDPKVLQGNIDTRPFVARSGVAIPRKDGAIDIFFYERVRTVSEVCNPEVPPMELTEAERLIWVQMPWPLVSGTEGQSWTHKEPNFWGSFFHVQRGHGSTSKRAPGEIVVERSQSNGGTLYLDVATENNGDLHGSARGSMSFEICPR